MGLTEKLILPYIQEIEWNARNSVWVFSFLNLQMVFFWELWKIQMKDFYIINVAVKTFRLEANILSTTDL